jgi:dolichol-phosphate mannosyltransferase
MDQTLVSGVLPVFNEAKVLDELVERVSQAIELTGAKYEVVFVNDGSTHGSAAILEGLAATNPQIRVVHLSRNFGHQAAVQAGLAHASGDVVMLMDSDLQDSPEAIGRFLAEWRAGYDVVYAVRSERQEAWWKRCLFDGFHQLLAAISTTPVPAHAGNFSLIDRRVVREIVALGERDRYLPGLRAWVGYRQRGLEVRRAARYDDQPRVSLHGLVRLAKTAIFSFSTVPLAVFYWIGYSSLALVATLSAFALYCKLFTVLAIPGWTSEMLVGSFFGAVNALGISILGEYVVRIYDQVRGRPMYLVARTCNLKDAVASEEQQYQSLLEQSRELLSIGESGTIEADANESDIRAGAERRKAKSRRKQPQADRKPVKRMRKSSRVRAK